MKIGDIVRINPENAGPPGIVKMLEGSVGLVFQEYELVSRLERGQKVYSHLITFPELVGNSFTGECLALFSDQVEVLNEPV